MAALAIFVSAVLAKVAAIFREVGTRLVVVASEAYRHFSCASTATNAPSPPYAISSMTAGSMALGVLAPLGNPTWVIDMLDDTFYAVEGPGGGSSNSGDLPDHTL
ncbi:hypothetical protein EV182_001696, partial [Spiromyces aspiralis]